MRRAFVILTLLAACGLAPAQAGPESAKVRVEVSPTLRFLPLEVHLDTRDTPLAAWQFELTCDDPAVRIVGLEGGDHRAFADAPYYDPAAMQTHRVIAASFDTQIDDLPAGPTRIATVHVMIPADSAPTFTLELTAAADPGARRIPATATIVKGNVQ